MQITPKTLTIRELTAGYADRGDDGVWTMDDALNVRPSFQRDWVYDDRKRDLVIDSVMRKLPLNTMYWGVNDDGYEIIDGQQRTLSICKYVNGDFSFNGKYFHNLTEDEQDEFLSYDSLIVYVCEGTDRERLDWFERINTSGEPLNRQELLNAVYAGPWLTSAKRYFSKHGGPAFALAADLIRGVPIRQEYLATALEWVSEGDVQEYMATHQHDDDAEALWTQFTAIVEWVRKVFPQRYAEMKGVPWGRLYASYKHIEHDDDRDTKVAELMRDCDVQNRRGIFDYVLSGRESALRLRAFDERTKHAVYEQQNHRCPMCVKEGNDKEYAYEEMDGDHIVPFSKGGHTTPDNCQMLCIRHNRGRS